MHVFSLDWGLPKPGLKLVHLCCSVPSVVPDRTGNSPSKFSQVGSEMGSFLNGEAQEKDPTYVMQCTDSSFTRDTGQRTPQEDFRTGQCHLHWDASEQT